MVRREGWVCVAEELGVDGERLLMDGERVLEVAARTREVAARRQRARDLDAALPERALAQLERSGKLAIGDIQRAARDVRRARRCQEGRTELGWIADAREHRGCELGALDHRERTTAGALDRKDLEPRARRNALGARGFGERQRRARALGRALEVAGLARETGAQELRLGQRGAEANRLGLGFEARRSLQRLAIPAGRSRCACFDERTLERVQTRRVGGAWIHRRE